VKFLLKHMQSPRGDEIIDLARVNLAFADSENCDEEECTKLDMPQEQPLDAV
jgi:hypothetical protein